MNDYPSWGTRTRVARNSNSTRGFCFATALSIAQTQTWETPATMGCDGRKMADPWALLGFVQGSSRLHVWVVHYYVVGTLVCLFSQPR